MFSGIKTFFENYSLPEVFLTLVERKLKIRLPINPKLRWKFNISSEIRFWDKCIKTNGLIWPEEYKLRFDPELPLQEKISRYLPRQKEVNILDVGAGPFTYLGKIFDGIKLNIRAIDPLADEYDKILQKYSIAPLIRTTKLDAENLTAVFGPNSFDLVFARNCIDHAYSPENAILEMLHVVKKGCFVFMMHRPNEAENENWQGLHQWNFSEENGDFIISSKQKKINFSKKYKNLCEIICELEPHDNMLDTIIRKL